MNPLFDTRAVFFSCYGSYLSLSHTDRGVEDGLYLRHIRGGVVKGEVFRLTLLHNGKSIPFTEVLTPTRLRLQAEPGYVDITFMDADTLELTGEGVALRFFTDSTHSEYDTAWTHTDGTAYSVHYRAEIKCEFSANRGQVILDAPWLGARTQHINVTYTAENSGYFNGVLHTFLSTPQHESPPLLPQAHYTAWRAASLPVPEYYAPAHELATYINWAGVVHPRGNLNRPAMYMSKNWMCKIWGWDNCFNALAHVQQNPQLAWDQLMLFVDHQGDDGAFPDHITDVTKSFRFYKPPIFGWAIRQMMTRSDAITIDHLAEIYPALCRWTDWWFTYRDDNKDGLPHYNHGNESGWDNGTVFASGVPVESPDLAAYLILQMDFLATTAFKLNRGKEAATWTARADKLLNLLLSQLWDGEQFRARHTFTHQTTDGDSLLVYMPLLLGERLPDDMRRKLVAGVQRFLTPHGLATEHPDSPYYAPDGYWRGPVWAPSTYLVVGGLLACGERDTALDIARRFCEMALQNGMAENYDAVMGTGLRDRAYTWTASVFLLLGNLLMHTEKTDLP